MKESEITWTHLEKLKETGPLVHNITNYVVMNTECTFVYHHR